MLTKKKIKADIFEHIDKGSIFKIIIPKNIVIKAEKAFIKDISDTPKIGIFLPFTEKCKPIKKL